uniref:Protein kinase domain-containing protein n=1 Tax=Romanomermis culicivorax TaxID=13658 RepID=A0A915ICC6_ROMCU
MVTEGNKTSSMSGCFFQCGTVVHRNFKVNRLIGKGGRGEVYDVIDLANGKRYALKVRGPNLSKLRRTAKDKKFTESTALRVGLSCLDAIQELHSIGLLHRDIKPANFAIDREPEMRQNVYLLDFGSVRRYRMKNGKLREPRRMVIFRGTVKYGSANALSCFESGCHDDLISWFYMDSFVEFGTLALQWVVNSLHLFLSALCSMWALGSMPTKKCNF